MKTPNKRPAAHNRARPPARAGTKDLSETQALATERREQQRLAKQRAVFLAAAAEGDLAALVQIARQALRDHIWAWGALADDVVPLGLITNLAGALPKDVDGSRTWDAYTHGTAAAFALGIAMGQLVHSDVFTMGGVK